MLALFSPRFSRRWETRVVSPSLSYQGCFLAVCNLTLIINTQSECPVPHSPFLLGTWPHSEQQHAVARRRRSNHAALLHMLLFRSRSAAIREGPVGVDHSPRADESSRKLEHTGCFLSFFLIPPRRGHVFTPRLSVRWLVGLFICRITQKLPDGFHLNLVGKWGMSRGRSPYILEWIQEFFLSLWLTSLDLDWAWFNRAVGPWWRYATHWLHSVFKTSSWEYLWCQSSSLLLFKHFLLIRDTGSWLLTSSFNRSVRTERPAPSPAVTNPETFWPLT